MNFLGTWRTDKGNLVQVIKQLVPCCTVTSAHEVEYWIGQHWRVNFGGELKVGFTSLSKDNAGCLIDENGIIIIGEHYSIGEKLIERKRSEEEKGWLL